LKIQHQPVCKYRPRMKVLRQDVLLCSKRSGQC
jgi:hypothetical protein